MGKILKNTHNINGFYVFVGISNTQLHPYLEVALAFHGDALDHLSACKLAVGGELREEAFFAIGLQVGKFLYVVVEHIGEGVMVEG